MAKKNKKDPPVKGGSSKNLNSFFPPKEEISSILPEMFQPKAGVKAVPKKSTPAKKKTKGGTFRNRSSINASKKEAGASVAETIGDLLDVPQKLLVKGATGRFEKPSEFVDKLYQQEYPDAAKEDNSISRAVTDIAVDPLNLLGLLKFGSYGMKGERILSATDKAKKGVIKGSSIYDNVGEVTEKFAFGGQVDPLIPMGTSGLQMVNNTVRPDGTFKGKGYYGEVPYKTADGSEGVMTELTSTFGFDEGDIDMPLLVPGLNKAQMQYMQAHGGLGDDDEMNRSIEDVAVNFSRSKKNPYANFAEEGNTPLPMFAFGGNVKDPLTTQFQNQYRKKINTPNYIKSPEESLAQNDIAMANAMMKAQSNPLTQGLDIFGNLAMQYGMNMMGKTAPNMQAVEGLTSIGELGGYQAQELPEVGMPKFNLTIPQIKAYGGKVQRNVPVEVEGKEVAETPNGQVIDFQGPSHEQGGIKTDLPGGTDIYSKRIKDNKGKSMAKRKLEREGQEKKLSSKYKKQKSDSLLKNTLDRVKTNNDKMDKLDMMLQESLAKNIEDGIVPKFAGGGVVGMDMETAGFQPGLVNSPTGLDPATLLKILNGNVTDAPVVTGNTNFDWMGKAQEVVGGLPTGGDMLGMLGNLKQAYDPAKTTLANRAGDTPNTNPYTDYGKQGLQVIDSMKSFATQTKDAQAKELMDRAIQNRSSARNSARGVNTMRALDIAGNNSMLNAMNDVNNSYATQMLGILGQEAQAKNQQDQVVMKGAESADLANRQDRDAFYTNLGKDQRAIGEGITRTGKAVNEIKARNVNENFLNMLYDYVDGDLKSGTAKVKDGVDVTRSLVGLPGENNVNLKEAAKDKTNWENFINPETKKVFKDGKEWAAYQKKRQENPYLDTPTEADSSYKNFIDPLTKSAFKSKTDYDKFLATGKKADQYLGQDLYTGNTFYKNLPKANYGEAKDLLGGFLNKNNMSNFNIDNKEDVKKLEKMLGLKETGHFGKGVYEALRKNMLDSIDIDFS